MSILERERAMVFPDYYFFAERYLVNHTIEKKRVNNLDDCELMCYLNDDCVSLNFKRSRGWGTASHLWTKQRHSSEIRQWLDNWCQFLLSWVEGELQIDFSKLWPLMFLQIFVYSIIQYFVSSLIFHSFSSVERLWQESLLQK